MAHIVIFFLCLALACGFALWKGGGAERAVALLLVAATVATFWVQISADALFQSIEADVLFIDAVLWLALGAIASTSTRFWPIWITGIHGLAIGVHASKAINPAILPAVYAQAVGKLGYPILLILVLGTWRHLRRRGGGMADPSWPAFWLLSTRSARVPGPTP